MVAVLTLALLFSASPAGASEAGPFGITKFSLEPTQTKMVPLGYEQFEVLNEPYTFTQAGGHPWGLTTTIEFTSEEQVLPNFRQLLPTRDPRDIVVDVPPGLLANPTAVPRCPLTVVFATGACPAATQIGVANIRLFGGHELLGPIVNVVPEAGQSAEFALENNLKLSFLLTAHLVRTAQGYGFTVVDNGVPEAEISRVETTFWGVPADPSHNALRGLVCQKAIRTVVGVKCNFRVSGDESGVAPVPFLIMPNECSAGALTATVRADTWEEPGHVGENQKYERYAEAKTTMPGASGCDLLSFRPSIELQPDTSLADAPVGVGVSVQVPQPETPEALATPDLRDAVVTLPEGMSISPGVVDGIQACDLSGPEGINFTGPESEEVGLNGELQLAPGHCPDASIVGEAEAISPLLGTPVKGHVYLARPGCGGAGQSACTEADALDGNLYQLYLELGGTGAFAASGIQIKVPGYTEANPATGQLTTKFLENPQAPFSELKIHLNGGPRASLANPAVCGPATTTSDFTPWSEPGVTPEGLGVAGTADATPSSFFEVSGCASPPGLRPGFTAGTVTPQAGQFSQFTLNLSREDREQYVKGIQVHTPPGLSGELASVPLCGEPAADRGTCPQSSQIGTTRVATGAGSHPFEISGNVYLTGPYDGEPFGLSIVTDAVAGPFNLGLIVVRARIAVDPENATLTVTTDETGPYAVPQIVFGVPLRLKRVSVDIDRPGFMFNPTNCGAPGQPGMQQVTATVSGSQQALASVSSSFAVAGCKSLEFKPKFVVATSGHTSRAKGASLDAKLSYPAGSVGSEANIHAVKVDLPKQLPSRLTTLQKACTAQTFESDPAACPAASVIGIVRVKTPLLPVLLTGPVYFVSHGGEAFPSLEIVLQGDGVRVDVVAATFISKAGITSSTFKTVPDVPFESFELYLPEGKFSALAANGNLCTSKLAMPTAFTAQNGAEIHESTPIAVTGCPPTHPKAKKTTKKKKTKKKGKKASKARKSSHGQGRKS